MTMSERRPMVFRMIILFGREDTKGSDDRWESSTMLCIRKH